MQRESIAWLVIRTFGLACLGIFAFKILYFLANIVVILTHELPEILPFDTVRLPGLNWQPITEAALFLMLSIYFLRFGKLAHRWLIKENR